MESAVPPSPLDMKTVAEKAGKGLKGIVDRVPVVAGALGQLLRKLRDQTTPEDRLGTLEKELKEVSQRKEALVSEEEEFYGKILAKKKALESSPKARRQTLEMELKNLLTRYRSTQRELAIHLERENALYLVKSRIMEVSRASKEALSADFIDDLIEEVEAQSLDQEDLAAAAKDLEKAGPRTPLRQDDLYEALAEFDLDDIEPSVKDNEDAVEQKTQDPTPHPRPEQEAPES